MSLITVSGHLKNISGTATAGSVTFLLTNYGDNIARVIGTNVVAPISVTAQADATGAWSLSVQGNDTIDPGAANTPPTTYYSVTFADANGKVVQSLPFSFVGAGPSNLDSQAPLVTVPLPASPSGAALLGANQTFTGVNTFQGNTVLNGTLSGSGIPTYTLKTGNGTGDYLTTSTSYVDVDATNLAYTVTIPVGWKLAITVAGQMYGSTGNATWNYILRDGSDITATEQTFNQSFGVNATLAIAWLIVGNGASHTIKLQYKTSSPSDANGLINAIGGGHPTMLFILSPSN